MKTNYIDFRRKDYVMIFKCSVLHMYLWCLTLLFIEIDEHNSAEILDTKALHLCWTTNYVQGRDTFNDVCDKRRRYHL